MNVDQLKRSFEQTYDRAAIAAVQAPGRVNLIGEHTDYNDGFVLPIAIERQVAACLAPRDDRKVLLASMQAEETATIDLDEPISPGQPQWANYCRGVASGLAERGLDLCGADILLASDIPGGAGLSSSAALEVCTAQALLAAAGKVGAVPDRDLSLVCQRAENDFAGAPCGIMDQSISVMARPGMALLLDCRSGNTEHIPFDDPNMVLLVADTRVRHEIGAGQYGRRRACCESAAEKMGVSALRDADATKVDQARCDGLLTAVEARRARHVVTEIARTLKAADALKAGDYAQFGRLMYDSHASLRDDFEVSCDELDAVVESARQCGGVFGARMTGGGFGGSAIILAQAPRALAVMGKVGSDFQARFGKACGLFATRAAAGAGIIE